MTFDEVIEEHRQLVGAESVRISLGPKATPENLREILRKERETMAEYESFSEAERQAALKHRLKGYLSKCFRAVQKLDLRDPNQLAVRNEVMGYSDIIPDVAAHEDIPWMLEQRKKKALPCPERKSVHRPVEVVPYRCPECGELGHNCDPEGVGHYRG